MTRPRYVAWFSCGAASAVAAKLAVDKYGEQCEVVYCDTMATEHPDNQRFFNDVQRWIGRHIIRVKSSKFKTVDEVFERTRYMAGPAGARCTVEMKKAPRVAWQRESDTHIFGYTLGEERRANGFEERNKELHVEWILIEKGISKKGCLNMLGSVGIALPVMYSLGFDHNNCIGCVKATSPKYWNLIRDHFPDVFAKRITQSRNIGVRLARYKGERVFLDEMPADATGPDEDIECGPMCQMPLEGFR